LERFKTRNSSLARPLALVVGLLVVGWLFNTPAGLLGKADAVGYAVCHRIDVRSYHLGARQIPLCARCTGMYLGTVLGMFYQYAVSRRRSGMPPWVVVIPLAVLAAAFAVDGLNSYLHLFPGAPGLYEPKNWSRTVTGTGMGLVIAAFVYPAFNQSAWRKRDSRPALDSLSSLAILLLLAALMDWLVLSENPLLLYPLALVSAAGVLLILTQVYSMLWMMVLRSENVANHLSGLILPLMGGLGTAILQIALLDFIRFLLTGTWDGFHLG